MDQSSSLFVGRVDFADEEEITKTDYLTGIARIDPVADPVDLFASWRYEASRFNAKPLDVCCLATVSEDLKVSSRNLVLRAFDKDGFVVMTDARSRKINDIEHNPNAAMCFLWTYKNNKEHNVLRQVRIEGTMEKLKKADYQSMYNMEPLYCKIRSYVCHQGQPADWNELNRRYKEMLKRTSNNKEDLPMPDHVVAYKLLPEMMEFFYSWGELIADRIRYKKANSTGDWEYQRLAA